MVKSKGPVDPEHDMLLDDRGNLVGYYDQHGRILTKNFNFSAEGSKDKPNKAHLRRVDAVNNLKRRKRSAG